MDPSPAPGGEWHALACIAIPAERCGRIRSRCLAATMNQRAPLRGWTTALPAPRTGTPSPTKGASVRLCSHCTNATSQRKERRLPAPAATGEAALPACCAAGDLDVMPQVTGKGCNLITGRTGRCLRGHYLKINER